MGIRLVQLRSHFWRWFVAENWEQSRSWIWGLDVMVWPLTIFIAAPFTRLVNLNREPTTMPGIVTFLKRFLPNFPIKIALWTNAKHIIITVALTRPSVWIKCPINDFYLDFIIQFYLCPGIYLEWLSGHFNSSSPSIFLALIFTHTIIAGIRAFHPDGDPGDAAGGLGDWSRLHIRHQEAPAHDHLRRGEGAHTGEC